MIQPDRFARKTLEPLNIKPYDGNLSLCLGISADRQGENIFLLL